MNKERPGASQLAGLGCFVLGRVTPLAGGQCPALWPITSFRWVFLVTRPQPLGLASRDRLTLGEVLRRYRTACLTQLTGTALVEGFTCFFHVVYPLVAHT